MKALYIFLLSVFLGSSSFGQNLVFNPSFEDYIVCPTSSYQIGRASGWLPFRESPDYFNVCSIICNPWCVGVPNNLAGGQDAIGNGYAGLYFGGGYHEIMGTQLIDALIPGTRY